MLSVIQLLPTRNLHRFSNIGSHFLILNSLENVEYGVMEFCWSKLPNLIEHLFVSLASAIFRRTLVRLRLNSILRTAAIKNHDQLCFDLDYQIVMENYDDWDTNIQRI